MLVSIAFFATQALAGMRLNQLKVDGQLEQEGLRGRDRGDMLQVNGANQFWCGMLFNQYSEHLLNTIPKSELNASLAAADELGDGRATIQPSSEILVTGMTTPELMDSTGGTLSFSFYPGENPDFYSTVTPDHPDGGFPLGEVDLVFDAESVISWSQTLSWPVEAHYVGPYVVQVLFRPSSSPNRVFAQCIDFDVAEGTPLPAGCSDISECTPTIFPSGIVAEPLQDVQLNSLTPGSNQGMAPGIIAVIVIAGLLMLLMAFLVWCCLCRKTKDTEIHQPLAHELPDEPSEVYLAALESSSADFEPSEHSKSGCVQIQYTEAVAVDMPVDEPGTPDGSQGRVFHFRYVASNGDDASEASGVTL